jgi:co-chaperonin GroES (HSP10)
MIMEADKKTEKRFENILIPDRFIVIEMIDKKEFIREQTKGGIIIPGGSKDMNTLRQINTLIDHPYQGWVRAVGPKCEIAKVGMKAYMKYPHIFRTQHVEQEDTIIEQPVGLEFFLDGVEYRHMGEYEVLAFRKV